VFTQNGREASTVSSSFPKGYFVKMRDELPDPVSDNCSRETQPSSKNPKLAVDTGTSEDIIDEECVRTDRTGKDISSKSSGTESA
jgi:hypothetical protein